MSVKSALDAEPLNESIAKDNYQMPNLDNYIDIELFKTCLMLDVISFKKYIRSSLLSLNRVPSS